MSGGLGQRALVGVLSLVLLACISSGGWATTVYVDDDADPNGDGVTWQTAYDDLQAALDEAADPNSDVTDIHVSGGTYKPSKLTDPNDPRTATFQLLNGVAVKGGYAGLADPNDPDRRDVADYQTVLTGDIGTSDDSADNCYHVVTALNVDDTAVLDGFSVMRGNANGEGHDAGGGMLNGFSSTTIRNCTFTDSHAKLYGGGMLNLTSSPTIEACQFIENWAENEPFEEAYGGAMCNRDNSEPVLTGCTFIDNFADSGGGAVFNGGYSEQAGYTTMIDCLFVGNESYGDGAAIGVISSELTLVGCAFASNAVMDSGGALYFYNGVGTVQSCRFEWNYAVWSGGAVTAVATRVCFSDCVFVRNSQGYHSLSGGAMNAYSCAIDIARCSFYGNSAQTGGALCLGDSDELHPITVRECNFVGNHADGGGGAVYVDTGEWIGGMADCSFVGNSVGDRGAGMVARVLYDWEEGLTHCVFAGNSVEEDEWTQGATLILAAESRWTHWEDLQGCVIAGNCSGFGTGAVDLNTCGPTLSNFVVCANTVGGGRPSYTGGIRVGLDTGLDLRSSILWANWIGGSPGDTGLYAREPQHVAVEYSCLQGSIGDNLGYVEGNIIADPRFAPPLVGTWTAAGQYDPNTFEVVLTDTNASWTDDELVGKFVNPDTSQALQFPVLANTGDTITIWCDWATIEADASWVSAGAEYAIYDYHLQSDSPCINRGDPAYVTDPNDVDMDGDPRVVHGRVDIGADEYTGTLPPTRPALVATDAPPNGTWPKTQNNLLRLSFDMPIALSGGDPLSIVELADPNSDASSAFSYQLDPDDPNGLTLKATENGSQLSNQTWYRIAPGAGLDVHLFEVDVCTLSGDADGNRRVTTADYTAIKNHLGLRGELRWDLDGNGRVTTADYSVVKVHLGEQAPTKP